MKNGIIKAVIYTYASMVLKPGGTKVNAFNDGPPMCLVWHLIELCEPGN